MLDADSRPEIVVRGKGDTCRDIVLADPATAAPDEAPEVEFIPDSAEFVKQIPEGYFFFRDSGVDLRELTMIPVESSNLGHVGYASFTNVGDQLLLVTFKKKDGYSLYAYADVPPSVYFDLLTTESAGKFLNTKVKPTYQAVQFL